MQNRRTRASRMTADQRREAILRVVVPLLETQHGQVTTRQIAEAAGIAEGTIFRVFPDKRALFLQAAELAVAPPGWREELAATLEALPDLRAKVTTAVERMAARSRQVFLVLGALRSAVLTDRPLRRLPGEKPPAAPAFLTESSQQLLEAVTELVFEPHRDQLGVPPARASRALRALTMGTWHPGATDPDRLTPVEITDLLLDGVLLRPPTCVQSDQTDQTDQTDHRTGDHHHQGDRCC